MMRKDLKKIYDGLENSDKKKWAVATSYKSYQGLYRYLKNNGDDNATDKTMDGLKKAVGIDRFKKLTGGMDTNNVSFDTIGIDENFRSEVSKKIIKCEKIETLEEINKILNLLSKLTENQKERLNLLNYEKPDLS